MGEADPNPPSEISESGETDRAAEKLLVIQRDLGAALSGVSALEPAVEAVLDAMLRFEGFDCGGVYVVDPRSGAVDLVASRGLSERFVEVVSHFSPEAVSAQLVMAGKPVYRIYDELFEGTGRRLDDLNRREGLRAIAVVPMRHGEQVIGCLNAASRRLVTIPETSRQALEAIASGVAMAIARVRAEQDLRASEEMLRVVYENALDGILLAHAETRRFFMGNRAIARMLGYSRDEVLNLSVSDIHPPESLDYVVGHFERQARLGGYVAPDIPVLRKDGTVFFADVNSSVVTLGGTRYVVGVFRDVTERRRIQGQAFEAQRLESIGVLAGGIAHDFNNLLMGIEGNVSLALTKAKADPELQRLLAAADLATRRARDLTHQLLTFAKGGAPVRKAVAVSSFVTEPARFVLHGSSVQLRVQLEDDLWAVDADAGQLAQVVQNLVLNAVDAMGGHGVVEISAANVVIDEEEPVALRPGRYVRIRVSDTGCGIAPEQLSRIFDPYFTTKEDGSGLGLAVCYSVIAKHDGRIDVESTPDQGSTFVLTLPACDHRVSSAPPSAPAIQAEGGRALVMDDDVAVAKVVAAMLESCGYQATTVADGTAAVQAYREAKEAGLPFDAVILDLTVAGGPGGVECASEILAIDPDAKLIVSSGYSTDPVMARPREYGFRAVLSKPFRAGQLQKTLDKLRKG